MAIDPAKVWFPDGTTLVVTLVEPPNRGTRLIADGIDENAWLVLDVRASSDPELLMDVWVEAV